MTGRADELGFQAVPSSMSAVSWTGTSATRIARLRKKLLRVYFRTACLAHLSCHDVDAGAVGDRPLEGLITNWSTSTALQVIGAGTGEAHRAKEVRNLICFSRQGEVRPTAAICSVPHSA